MPEIMAANSLAASVQNPGKTRLQPKTNRLAKVEQFLPAVLTVIAVYLHTIFLVKAGGFWRDEANSIFLALKPALMDIWSASKTDSFPVLHLLLIRAWTYFFGATDTSLRTLGFSIGISIIIALWLGSRQFGKTGALVSLLFLGINPVIIRSVDSIRPYGLSALATIIGFTVVWRAVQKPEPATISIATVTLVLWAQTLYQSAFFIFAVGIAALTIGFLRGGLKRALLLSVPFIAAAASLLPYAGHLKAGREWSLLAMLPAGTATRLPGFLEALRSPAPWFVIIWILLGIVAIVGTVRGICQAKGRGEQLGFDLTLYCSVSLVVSSVGFILFLNKMVNFNIHYWHYVPLLVMIVICSGPLVEQAMRSNLSRIIILLSVAGFAVAVMISAPKKLAVRMTAIDLIASAIERDAKPDDIIIVSPWFLGVSFNRYYHGNAPWVTFPDLQDKGLHRFDLVKGRMEHPETISEDLARILSILQKGGRVWVVGDVYALDPGTAINPLPPAPLPATGWCSIPYISNWSDHLIFTLASHAKHSNLIQVKTVITSQQQIDRLESPTVALIQGWID
jgi:hypothetical protein